MSKLTDIQEQIVALENEAQRISLCQQKVGEHVFDLYERGLLNDELRAAIANIINEVELYTKVRREHSIVGDASGLSFI